MTLKREDYIKHDHLYPRRMIDAKIIADTLNIRINGKRNTTFLLTVPNIIHPEMLRHRVFSFSVSSNRAIPVKTVTRNATFYPVWRYRDKSGMQPGAFIEDQETIEILDDLWADLQEYTANSVKIMEEMGVTKELANRPTAPYQVFNMLVTSSTFSNFFALRDHELAQMEIQTLARRMQDKYETNIPNYVTDQSWHLPFITIDDKRSCSLEEQLLVSVARCARTSYLLPSTNKVSSVAQDIKLAKSLYKNKHMSPFEHVSFPLSISQLYGRADLPLGISSEFYGNTYGYVQLRKLLEPSQGNPEFLKDLRTWLREVIM